MLLVSGRRIHGHGRQSLSEGYIWQQLGSASRSDFEPLQPI